MIEIEKSPTADTRTCDWSKVTKNELFDASKKHIDDVRQGLRLFRDKLDEASRQHDWSKILKIHEFHEDFKTGFKTTKWFQMHQREERHHLQDKNFVQDDVNLIDIIEMITDCVMAGMARSGEYRKEEVSDELLRKAFDNTIKLLLDNVKVKP